MLQNIMDDLESLEPFGNKNPFPQLAFKYENATYFNLLKGEHLKFSISGISVLSFFNKHHIQKEGIIIGIPQLNIWENKSGKIFKNYQIMLNNYLKN